MERGEHHHAVSDPAMDGSSGVREALVLDESRYFEPAEYVDGPPVRGRDEIAAEHEDKEQRIESEVHEPRCLEFERRQTRPGGFDAGEAPGNAQDKRKQNEHSGTAVEGGGARVVVVVVVEADHPPANSEQCDYPRRHSPVQSLRD